MPASRSPAGAPPVIPGLDSPVHGASPRADAHTVLAAQEAKIGRIAAGLRAYCAGRTPVTGLIASQMLEELARSLRLAMDAARALHHAGQASEEDVERIEACHHKLARLVDDAEGATCAPAIDRPSLAAMAEEMERLAREAGAAHRHLLAD